MIFELAVPANTTEAAPVKVDYDIGRASIKGATVHVPDGHKYLTGCKVLTQGRVLIPDPGSGAAWIKGNGNNITFPSLQAIEGPPYKITLIGFNSDDTYAHTFYLEVH